MIDMFSEDLTVIRTSKDGSYVLGKYVPGKESTFKIRGTVEPLSAQMMMLLPEGERTKESIRIYTANELNTVDALNGRKADVVCYRGKQYEVHLVKHWTSLIPHYAVVAVLKNMKVGD